MDFLMGQRLIYTSEKYENIYKHFRENCDIKLGELFLIAMTIGFYCNKKANRSGKGREIRSNYFSTEERAAIYTIILTDPKLGRSIDNFDSNEFQLRAVEMMEEYAEGGMEKLVQEVFMSNWDGVSLDKSYNEYEIDILSYISSMTNEAPF